MQVEHLLCLPGKKTQVARSKHKSWLTRLITKCRFGPLDGTVPNEVTTNYAYLPFGGGKRKCIGDQFALFESVVALAMLMRRYEFRMAEGAPEVKMTTGVFILCVRVCVLF